MSVPLVKGYRVGTGLRGCVAVFLCGGGRACDMLYKCVSKTAMNTSQISFFFCIIINKFVTMS